MSDSKKKIPLAVHFRRYATGNVLVLVAGFVSFPITARLLSAEDFERLVGELQKVEGVAVRMPAGTFYAFPDVSAICRRLGITSHGLAMYLLEGADDATGVACLGGECFGPAGQGFLRFSCAEPDGRLVEAVAFLREAVTRWIEFLDGGVRH